MHKNLHNQPSQVKVNIKYENICMSFTVRMWTVSFVDRSNLNLCSQSCSCDLHSHCPKWRSCFIFYIIPLLFKYSASVFR